MKRLTLALTLVLLFTSSAFSADLWDDRWRKVQTTRATGAAAMATTVPVSGTNEGAFELIGFYLKVGVAATTSENFTVTLDSGGGAAYDTVIYSRDLSDGSVTSLVYMFDKPPVFTDGDEIDFAWANTDTRTYGLTILWREKR